MRPIGGWLLGRFAGDHLHPRVRHDRNGGTGPTRARPAAAGPSVGGKYATSATYLSEVATSGRRGYYSSFQYVTLTAGQLLALVLADVGQSAVAGEAPFPGRVVSLGAAASGAAQAAGSRHAVPGRADADRYRHGAAAPGCGARLPGAARVI
jgi:MHS family alpha-ketoglutarate permease-like MFS transporter